MAVGIARAALDDALKYAAERRQFGKPINRFQAIQLKLDEMGTALEAEMSHTASVAGDPNVSNVRYTKFELQWSRAWQDSYDLELKIKPVVDWIQNGRTGAVAEIELGMHLSRDWRTWIMLGHRAWGPSGIAATYQTRLELGLNYTY